MIENDEEFKQLKEFFKEYFKSNGIELNGYYGIGCKYCLFKNLSFINCDRNPYCGRTPLKKERKKNKKVKTWKTAMENAMSVESLGR